MTQSPGGFKQKFKKFVKQNKWLYTTSQVLLGNKPLSGGLKTNVNGKGNKINYPASATFVNCKINITGNNNNITVDDFCRFNNVTFTIKGDNNIMTLANNIEFRRGGVLWVEDDNCLLEIGEKSTFQNVHIAVTEPQSQIVIGKECMLAYDIDLRTGDSHSIIDINSGKRINYAQNIHIGDHVWIGAHTTVLKGVSIEENTIIATRSVVTKSFEQGSVIIGGSPAKILREGVTWDRKRIYDNI
ncbi:acyltransferase [Inquilinus sp. KBS0705]|nr:acyltransferase [Inquilinus sp. KBS0705]